MNSNLARTLISIIFLLISIGVIFVLSPNINHVPDIGWHTADDHMITQRVAYNFWNFGVPYFNITDSVAANTSLFWPMLLSLTYNFLPLEYVVVFLIALSLLLWAGIIFLSLLATPGKIEKVIMIFVLTMLPGALLYAPTGWEHIPQTFFVTLGMLGILRCRAQTEIFGVPDWSLISVSTSFIFRPDSAVSILIVGMFWFFTESRFRRVRTYAILLALITIPIVYLGLMDIYYGSFVPNTAFLKVGDLRENIVNGTEYISNPYLSGPVPVVALALVFAIRKLTQGEIIVLICALGHIFYVVMTGGDVFPGGRMLIIYLPAITIITVRVFSRITRSRAKLWEVMGCCALAVMISNVVWNIFDVHSRRTEFGGNIMPVVGQMKVASKIKEKITPRDGAVGLHWLGIGYHLLDYKIVDFLGKAEPHIARTQAKWGPVGHNKWDYGYAFKEYDIAVAPARVRLHEKWKTRTKGDVERNDYAFWDVFGKFLEGKPEYEFVYPGELGLPGSKWGLYVREDLVEKVKGTH